MKTIRRISSGLMTLVLLGSFSIQSLAGGNALSLSMEEAVLNGIEKSKILDEVEVEVDLARVSKSRGRWTSRKLRRSEKDIKDATSALNTAQDMLEGGKLPQDVEVPGLGKLPAGTDIDSLPVGEDVKDQIISGVKKEIDKNKDRLDSGDYAIANALDQAGATIGSALDFASLDALTLDGSADLIELMPDVAFEVTQASYDIYKNNIALLIQKSYYDVLQAQELVRVRERTMERAKKQYEFSKASYEEGMKAKDDALTAEMYYKATRIALEQARGDLETKKTDLKKNASIDMGRDIVLEDVMVSSPEVFNLDKGLESGMKNRLEIKKTLGEVLIYNTNFSETKKRYTSNTFQYKEADLLKKKAGIKYRQAQDEVESSIRKSFDLVENTGRMLEETKGLVEKARENVEITQLKYQEGFGVNTNMLASLNLNESAGTILEVLAAEEKLAEAEENVVKIKYAYNLSRMQHKNNVGDFVY